MNLSARRVLGAGSVAAIVALLVWQIFDPMGTGSEPLQSPIDSPVLPTPTPSLPPTLIPTASPTPSPLPTPTPTISPTPSPTTTPPLSATFTPTSTGEPNTRATSEAVIATITALAATPTYPPTPTPRPSARRIGAGGAVSLSPTPVADGIVLTALSRTAYAGGAASLAVRTRPSTVCTLEARDNQTGSALEVPGATRRAGSDGSVAWIWAIPADQPAGSLTVRVQCESAGEAVAIITVSR
ncbi:MAG: hypothetical protein RMJ86_05900 [Anaerolineae bacterium]|nr:hypothetical protein [Thermoflexales bacterium]MDW8054059.1 hypothetical protein [Anaerolineae bacterium]